MLAIFLASVAAVFATSISAKPASGPRDNGNDVQTPITVTGDLSDTVINGFNNLGAYWDLPPRGPNRAVPDDRQRMVDR